MVDRNIELARATAVADLAHDEAYPKGGGFIPGLAHDVSLYWAAGLSSYLDPRANRFLTERNITVAAEPVAGSNAYRATARRGHEIIMDRLVTPSEMLAAVAS